ncbi:GNAT family N-acetyltransferase [Nocardioides sp.]|uniref:GNAT family N-acetyltransferase n=1 Tax=Nocardioides sp. TaxID=35761 RepID=UPI002ED5D706
MALDADAVRAAAARWIWVPVDATEVTTDEFRLTHYTDYSSVQWSRATRPVADLLEEVLDHARAAGRPRLRWWIDERTEPADTEPQLAALGLELTERLEVLALPVGTELPVPADVTVAEVRDRAGVELASRLQREVFAQSPDTEAHLAEQTRLAALPDEERLSRCYVAYVDGEPAAAGGSTVDGDALRFWDGSVLPAFRGRGAYRALVAHRLREARATTAEFALVKAVDDTSAPILKRLGFTRYGEQHCWSRDL